MAEKKSLDELPFSEFSKHLNSRFKIRMDAARELELELVEAVHYGGGSSGWNAGKAPTESFSLFFVGPASLRLPQHIYQLSHSELGELRLFLVAVAMEKQGFKYEAAFNRVVPKP